MTGPMSSNQTGRALPDRMLDRRLKLVWGLVVPVTALAMVGLVALPARTWRGAETGRVYQGFDRNLISVSEETFRASNPGVVQVSNSAIRITTVSSSRPAVHLVTTSLSQFRAEMDIVILDNPAGTEPLRLGIWSPRSASGFFLVFGPAPDNSISTESVADGVPAQMLLDGTVSREVVGSYALGQPYHLRVRVDKTAGQVAYQLTGGVDSPTGDPAMSLVGGPSSPTYSDISSRAVSVQSGHRYNFGAFVKLLSGTNAYKVSVAWLDKSGHIFDFSGNWKLVNELNGWTKVGDTGIAPSRANFGQLVLGSGDGTSLLFGDGYLSESSTPGVNLLYNPSLKNGITGWTFLSKPNASPQLVQGAPLSIFVSVTPAQAAGLLNSLKLTFSVSALSTTGSSSSLLQNYVLTLPSETAGAIRVDDQRARFLLVTLIALGATLVTLRVLVLALTRARSRATLGLQAFTDRPRIPSGLTGKTITISIAGIGGFLGLNALLFGLGNSPFDMASQKAWSYIAATYGPGDLYSLPAAVSVASVWGGVPYHEAVFPYQPAMAYLFAFEGWIDRLFLSGPGGVTTDTFQLEFLAKLVNGFFVLADGVLIYVILERLKTSRGWSLAAALLFILNPVVWFSTSIWGANHVITLFVVLLAIWFIETEHPTAAWIAVGIASLSRPQMLILAFVVGLVMLKKFAPMQNVKGVAWMVIVAFLLLGPFTLQTSPSFPVDFLANTLRVQEFGGNERALTTVSLDVYSVWPLVTWLASGQSGLDRIFYPSDSSVWGLVSYRDLALLLTAGLLALTAALILLRSRSSIVRGGYIPVVGLAIVGFLMLMTGISSAHFILALPFIILSVRWVSPSAYLAIVALWSITTLITMWGILGIDLADANYLGLPLFGSGTGLRSVTHSISTLYAWDRFITAGTVANCVVFAAIGIAAITSHFSQTWIPVQNRLNTSETG